MDGDWEVARPSRVLSTLLLVKVERGRKAKKLPPEVVYGPISELMTILERVNFDKYLLFWRRTKHVVQRSRWRC